MTKNNGAERPLKCFLLCSGLGRVMRGYESFARECFDSLKEDPALEMTLLKGAGPQAPGEIVVPCLPRESRPAIVLGETLMRRNPIMGEYVSFFLNSLPHILWHKPDVLFFSDAPLGKFYQRWRRVSGQSFRMLLCNGAPVTLAELVSPRDLRTPRFDHIHQVTPRNLDAATAAGISPERQTLLVQGVQLPQNGSLLSDADRRVLRIRLGLPEDRPILLSVAAINYGHKRLDYVIEELARMPEAQRPFLMMLGQLDHQSEEIRALATRLLGPNGFRIATVSHEEVGDYYRSADLFVLASTNEGFGRVLLEALTYGLPCFAHDYDVARYVLGTHGHMADLEQEGSLAGLLAPILAAGRDDAQRHALQRYVAERFSWQSLRAEYVAMIRRCAAHPLS
jgi:1,2-diacylglycerol 3-alpha-glucosyltransferase